MHKIKILLQCGVHGQASVAPPTFLAIAPLNFLTFPVYSSPFQAFLFCFVFSFLWNQHVCSPELPLNHTHINKTKSNATRASCIIFITWKPNFQVNFQEVFGDVTFKVVFERYFDQRFLDGLQRKAQAYSGKIGRISGEKPWHVPIFKKKCHAFFVFTFFLSPVFPARDRDMRSHFSSLCSLVVSDTSFRSCFRSRL